MAQTTYDGGMAAYFLLTFLALILVPLTLSFAANFRSSTVIQGCKCQDCIENREKIGQKERSTFGKLGSDSKTIFLSIGWLIFAGLVYFVLNTSSTLTVYDPFTILGISSSATEKEIKKFYKKLSLKFHPDTVKLDEGQTAEDAAAHFIELTKAYKALTDEVVRKNFEEYGHPDGKQTVEMGLALPPWVVDAHNNIWVLGAYGILIGGLLPYLVGKWWFGSRSRTKDGVHSKTAGIFFKDITEDATPATLVSSLSKGLEVEKPHLLKRLKLDDIRSLQEQVSQKLGATASAIYANLKSKESKIAFTLLYAHLLRVDIPSAPLRSVQKDLLLQMPVLLGSVLAMALGHGWLPTTIEIMHLHAGFTQAILPGKSNILQFPLITEDALEGDTSSGLEKLLLLVKDDPNRARGLLAATSHISRLDVYDASFRVVGERIITPGAFVQLTFKVRQVQLLSGSPARKEQTPEEVSAEAAADAAFLESKAEVEDIPSYQPQWAHAPYWPANRKASWWCVVGDLKTQKIFVPPFKFTDVPWSNPEAHPNRDYRTYKLQFQAPQQVGTYTLHITFVSDTFVGEDQSVYMTLQVDDISSLGADEQMIEDDISEPEEDTLAGQMAAMRGGKVKKSPYHGSDDEESTTDGDNDSDSDSSDSD
ncbi:secretory subunit [Serendipita sp. 411]|nr:secretory subunit [Serendipita sp. 401]KAG8845818.1 secretory subunit [Serendipita sp. 411]KAG9057201.1 secretory subunit [Serendipita sp. 407]